MSCRRRSGEYLKFVIRCNESFLSTRVMSCQMVFELEEKGRDVVEKSF
jgi:hypothetical protein